MKLLLSIFVLIFIHAEAFVLEDIEPKSVRHDCRLNTRATHLEVTQILYVGEFDFSSPRTKKLMLCMLNKWKVLNVDRTFNKSEFLNLIPTEHRTKLQSLTDECINDTIAVNSAIAWDIGKCLSEGFFQNQLSDKTETVKIDCLKETGASIYAFKKIEIGKFEDDNYNLKKAIVCLLKKAGIISDDNKIKEEEIPKKYSLPKLEGTIEEKTWALFKHIYKFQPEIEA